MRIDNRLLLPFVLPFALLITARALWWLAGADWNYPEVAAGMSLVFGGIIGLIAMLVLLDAGDEIGYITIRPWWRK